VNIQNLSKIQTILDEMTSTKYTPGINCLIIKDGKEVAYYESGLSDCENNIPITRDSIFRLYSMSKTVTSVATFILVEKGIIDLFDDVSKYLPGFASAKVALPDGSTRNAKRQVRIYDLLSMSSGIPYPEDKQDLTRASIGAITDEVIEKMNSDHAISTVDFANRIGQCPLLFDPGSHFKYGFSADILGAVIEVASGMKFGDFLKKNIFDPLGMNSTGFYVPKDKLSLMTKVYISKDNQLEFYDYPNLAVGNCMTSSPAFESGGAGLYSRIDDFIPFSQMLLNKGTYNGVRIISPETVKYMTGHKLEKHLQKDMDEDWQHLSGYSYGNLFRVMKNSENAMSLGENGEFGWDGWLGTYIAMDPVNNLTILLMQQRHDTGTTEYTRKIRNIVYSSL